jgi:flavin-binding protein dodecin
LEKEKASSASAAAEAEKSMAALRWMLVGGSDGRAVSAAVLMVVVA